MPAASCPQRATRGALLSDAIVTGSILLVSAQNIFTVPELLSVAAFASSNGSGYAGAALSYCRASRAKREHAIMRSAPNRHAPIALQRRPQGGYPIVLFANLSTAQSFAAAARADTTQPPL
jgi:hypothetical protein